MMTTRIPDKEYSCDWSLLWHAQENHTAVYKEPRHIWTLLTISRLLAPDMVFLFFFNILRFLTSWQKWLFNGNRSALVFQRNLSYNLKQISDFGLKDHRRYTTNWNLRNESLASKIAEKAAFRLNSGSLMNLWVTLVHVLEGFTEDLLLEWWIWMAGFEAAWCGHKHFVEISRSDCNISCRCSWRQWQAQPRPYTSVNYAAGRALVACLAAGVVPCDVVRPWQTPQRSLIMQQESCYKSRPSLGMD